MNEPDSIAGVVERIEEWIRTNVQGVVWIRYLSDVSRDLCIEKLQADLQIHTIRFAPPVPNLAFDWLEKRLDEVPETEPLTVVSLTFPDGQEAELLEAIYSLNLRREDLIQRPLIQLWWMAERLSPKAQDVAPDLVSWFKIRLRLRELPPLSKPKNALSSFVEQTALQAATSEVENLRRSFESTSSTGTQRLAAALERQSIFQATNGLQQEALDSLQEAVRLYLTLTAEGEATFQPALARSLGALANRQREAGQREAALETAQEAVTLYLDLVGRNREAFLPDLAKWLNNQTDLQIEAGQREAGLVTAQEAETLYRELVGRNREAFLPDLVKSLSILASVHRSVQDHSSACKVLEEALPLSLELFSLHPAAFLPLANGVANLYVEVCQKAGRDPVPAYDLLVEQIEKAAHPPG